MDEPTFKKDQLTQQVGDVSMVLGEATAISILQDQAQTFNEKFTVHFTKLDGNTATISNE